MTAVACSPVATRAPAWAAGGRDRSLGADFLDLSGASGAVYRFRLWAGGGSHPRVPGNFVHLARAGGRWRVLHIGLSHDLARTCLEWDREPAAQRAGRRLATRLNVSGAIRRAEDADLQAKHGAPGVPEVSAQERR